MEGLFHPQVRVELKNIVENMNRKIQAPDAHLGKKNSCINRLLSILT